MVDDCIVGVGVFILAGNIPYFGPLLFVANFNLSFKKDPGGGYSVERWVRGCAAQIGCIFSPTGFSMTPFYFKIRF